MIPVWEPLVGEPELRNVVECVKSGAISGTAGTFIGGFEDAFAGYCGVRHGVAASSGTTALHLALAALELGAGDEVILPTFTNAASVFSVIYVGATPVVIDSEPRTWNMDVRLLETKITPRTKAIMVVHIYGHPVEMEPVWEIAARHNLIVIEDAAEAHGAEYKGRRCGSLGRLACFSFYANKIVATGEGGMVVTDDTEVAERARILRNLAFSPQQRFFHEHLGFNYRLTNIQAAIGLAQMGRIDDVVARKREIAAAYHARLHDIPGIRLPVEEPWAKNVYWMYGLLVPKASSLSRDELMTALRARGIESRAFFFPMNRQPAFHARGLFLEERCPVAEDLGARGLYLPSGPTLKDSEIDTVTEAVRELLGARRRVQA
jgi:perosamine synthetase